MGTTVGMHKCTIVGSPIAGSAATTTEARWRPHESMSVANSPCGCHCLVLASRASSSVHDQYQFGCECAFARANPQDVVAAAPDGHRQPSPNLALNQRRR